MGEEEVKLLDIIDKLFELFIFAVDFGPGVGDDFFQQLSLLVELLLQLDGGFVVFLVDLLEIDTGKDDFVGLAAFLDRFEDIVQLLYGEEVLGGCLDPLLAVRIGEFGDIRQNAFFRGFFHNNDVPVLSTSYYRHYRRHLLLVISAALD